MPCNPIRPPAGCPTAARVCGMTSLGPDATNPIPEYRKYEYCEYPEGVAFAWLTQRGFSA